MRAWPTWPARTGSGMTATSSENGRCVIGTSNASSGSVPMPPARRSAAGLPCASPSPSASNGNSRLDEYTSGPKSRCFAWHPAQNAPRPPAPAEPRREATVIEISSPSPRCAGRGSGRGASRRATPRRARARRGSACTARAAAGSRRATACSRAAPPSGSRRSAPAASPRAASSDRSAPAPARRSSPRRSARGARLKIWRLAIVPTIRSAKMARPRATRRRGRRPLRRAQVPARRFVPHRRAHRRGGVHRRYRRRSPPATAWPGR